MAETTADANARDTSWPVKMAQYIPPPSEETLASALPFFKKRRCSSPGLPGRWLSSKSIATVTLSSASRTGLAPSIALILQGHVHEEHFLSTVAFTWPRFRDENGDTSHPSRVIFASYKKISTDEKRKFAMQFETVLQAEWFFKTAKQLIAGHSGSSEGIRDQQMDYSTPVSQVEKAKNYSLGMNTAVVGHSANFKALPQAKRTKSSNVSKDVLPLSELSVNVGVTGKQICSTAFDKGNSPLVLPPRFPSMDLQNHSYGANTNGCQQQEGGSPTIIAEGVLNEKNLKENIQACFLDPEFQRFVDKVERVWHSMEDDLATEMSLISS